MEIYKNLENPRNWFMAREVIENTTIPRGKVPHKLNELIDFKTGLLEKERHDDVSPLYKYKFTDIGAKTVEEWIKDEQS